MNKVMLIGRLTKDPEIRTSQGGTVIGRFALAVDNGKDKQGNKLTEFVNCTAFGRTAEIIEQYVRKGHQFGVTGKIQTSKYEKDGEARYSTTVIVQEFEFLQSKRETEGQDEFENMF